MLLLVPHPHRGRRRRGEQFWQEAGVKKCFYNLLYLPLLGSLEVPVLLYYWHCFQQSRGVAVIEWTPEILVAQAILGVVVGLFGGVFHLWMDWRDWRFDRFE